MANPLPNRSAHAEKTPIFKMAGQYFIVDGPPTESLLAPSLEKGDRRTRVDCSSREEKNTGNRVANR
jgi:hypothetical protein